MDLVRPADSTLKKRYCFAKSKFGDKFLDIPYLADVNIKAEKL